MRGAGRAGQRIPVSNMIVTERQAPRAMRIENGAAWSKEVAPRAIRAVHAQSGCARPVVGLPRLDDGGDGPASRHIDDALVEVQRHTAGFVGGLDPGGRRKAHARVEPDAHVARVAGGDRQQTTKTRDGNKAGPAA